MKKLWKRFKCRYDFKRLSPKYQALFCALKVDPDSLIAQGKL